MPTPAVSPCCVADDMPCPCVDYPAGMPADTAFDCECESAECPNSAYALMCRQCGSLPGDQGCKACIH